MPEEDQRKLMALLKSLEQPVGTHEIREIDLILGATYENIEHPEECLKELLGAGIIYRTEGPNGVIVKRTERRDEGAAK